MKHIVCSGCSFTRQWKRLNIDGNDTNFLEDTSNFWRWPHWIQKIYGNKFKVYNLGSPTNDNSTIKKSVFYKVNKLLKSGIDSKDIIVLVQWSNYHRNSFYIDKNKMEHFNSYLPKNSEEIKDRISKSKCEPLNVFAHISDYIEEKNQNGEFGYYLLTGGYNYDHIAYDVKNLISNYVNNFYSDEESLIRFFDNIISLQSFLDKLNISHLSFNIQNNFVLNQPELVEDSQNWKKSVYFDKWLPSTIQNENQYNNPYIQHLYELVNLENFWFLNSEETSKGGLVEWAIKNYNVNYKFPLYMEENVPVGHISSEMNKLFVEKELKDFLNV